MTFTATDKRKHLTPMRAASGGAYLGAMTPERAAEIRLIRAAATAKGRDDVKRFTRDWFLAALEEWNAKRTDENLEELIGCWRAWRGK